MLRARCFSAWRAAFSADFVLATVILPIHGRGSLGEASGALSTLAMPRP